MWLNLPQKRLNIGIIPKYISTHHMINNITWKVANRLICICCWVHKMIFFPRNVCIILTLSVATVFIRVGMLQYSVQWMTLVSIVVKVCKLEVLECSYCELDCFCWLTCWYLSTKGKQIVFIFVLWGLEIFVIEANLVWFWGMETTERYQN